MRHLCDQKDVDGLLVQLPLPPHLNEEAVIDALDPSKDVDGFHPVNVGWAHTNPPRQLNFRNPWQPLSPGDCMHCALLKETCKTLMNQCVPIYLCVTFFPIEAV